jgi:glycosyltransferase involved in cell wall biosynthesis
MNLSVVIPTYGRPNKIVETIESLSGYKNFEIELVVVDDNGIDSENQIKTKNILKDYIINNHIKYIPLAKNSGACIARNEGVKNANSDYITFLDDDDSVLYESLKNKYQFFINNQDYDICCSDMFVKYDNSSLLRYEKFRGLSPFDFLLDGMCLTSMIMFKKDTFLNIGGFTECKKYQDHVLMLKSYINDLKVCVFSEPTFIHNQEKNKNRISNKFSSENYLIRKNYELQLCDKLKLDNNSKRTLLFRQGIFETKEYPSFSFKTFISVLSLLKYVRTFKEILALNKRLVSKMLPISITIIFRRYF